MNTLVRNASRLLLLASALGTPMLALAIDNATQAIATDGYQKNMRTLEMMNKLDANGDHRVSRDEVDTYYTKLFAALDHNHDGKLDPKEWVGAGEDKEMASLSTGGYAREFASMDMMKFVDTDGDHLVSNDEFIKAHEAMFDRIAAGSTEPLDAKHWVAEYFPK